MASLFEDDFNSSDSEDDDYVPDKGELSSDEEDPIPSVCIDDENEKKELENKNDKERVLHSGDKKSCKAEGPKKTADDIYKSFLEEVESEIKSSSCVSSSSVSSSPACLSSSPACPSSSPACPSSSPACPSSSSSGSVNIADSSSSASIAESSSSVNTSDTPPIDFFDFAGETVSVNKESGTLVSSKTDNVPEKSEKPVPTLAVKRKGIGAVLGSIMDKKKKLSTLEKTALDWRSFKESEGIGEELLKFNKGKQGYIERQRFLQRSDIKSFEIERDMRLSKSKKT